MTKAEKIFHDTYSESRLHIKQFGAETNQSGKAVGWTGLITEEPVSIRTCNAVRKLMETERKYLNLDIQLGILTEERATLLTDALRMVEATIDNQVERIRG